MKKNAISLTLLFSVIALVGQTQNFQMHTVYMYSFAKFVQWPPEETQGDFEITVLGESPILTELKSMADKKKAGGIRTIRVNKISSLAEYKKSHILYISPDWSSKFQEVAAKIGDAPVLLVTDQAAGANKGCVNFVNNKEGKLGFEISQDQLTKHKLRAASELMRLAIAN